MKTDKISLRVELRDIRRKAKSTEKDEAICKKIIRFIDSENIDTVFIYSSIGTEIDTSSVIKYAIAKGIGVALPKCADENGTMYFYMISDAENDLVRGMFSITEPDIDKCRKAVDSENSLCIVPGLSFDRNGYRLGYGKGYYDRFLSNFKGKSIGLCYDACLCDKLPFDKYDRKVDTIITETETICLR